MAKTNKSPTKARPRRTFTPEFKAEAVRLCQVGDRSEVPPVWWTVVLWGQPFYLAT